jgi:hypothetical protein
LPALARRRPPPSPEREFGASDGKILADVGEADRLAVMQQLGVARQPEAA